jgi:hypothetical protein
MCRVASFVVADYWRKEKRKPTILSLDAGMAGDDGDTTELMETVADDKALDLEAWMDARTFLLGCPHRLVQIGYKRLKGINLTPADSRYLYKFRKREQKRLFSRGDFGLS